MENTINKIIEKIHKNLYYVHTMEYYSATKNNKLLLVLTTTWRKLRNIMLMKKARYKRVQII